MRKAPAPTTAQGAFKNQHQHVDFIPQADQLQLFPVLTPCAIPAPPQPGTKAWLLLRDLLEAEGVTQVDWLCVMGRGWRLAAAVKELRYLNWPIVDAWVHPSNSGYARIKRYALHKGIKGVAEKVIKGQA
jgi:hypothetical protein